MPDVLPYRSVVAGGITWRVADAGDGPAVLLVHGIHGVAYSWRHQIDPLVENGFRVIAPDMPGFGDTSILAEPPTFAALSDALVALLDALDATDVMAIGHDLGAPTVWTLAARHRARVRGLLMLSTPHLSGKALAPAGELSDDVAAMFATLSGDSGATWLTADELATYDEAFATSGFEGARAWLAARSAPSEVADDVVVDVPTYFLDGGLDPLMTDAARDLIGDMRAAMPKLHAVHTYDDAGHFIHEQCPREVNAVLVGFTRSIG